MKNIFICIIFLMLLITSQIFAENVYYVDATNGNDLDDGLSAATAWKTISKVNRTTFSPGDSILLKRGEIWREQITIPSSGRFVNPIKFSAYGSGDDPIINGADVIMWWIKAMETQENVWEATVTTRPKVVFFDGTMGNERNSQIEVNSEHDWYWNSNTIYVFSKSDPDTAYTSPGIEAGQRNCIRTYNKDYIFIQNITCNMGNTYGIFIWSQSDNITVSNCEIRYCGGDGIVIYNNPSGNNILIENNEVHHNGRCGIASRVTNNSASSGNENIIKSNYIYQNGEYGIYARSSYWIIEHNKVHDNGRLIPQSQGITIYAEGASPAGEGNNNIIRYNISYNQNNHGISADGNGIACDQWCENNEIYYNICYNNDGPGITCYNAGHNNIYNNACYGNSQGSGLSKKAEIKLLTLNGEDNTDNINIKNNIAYSTTSDVYCIYVCDNTYDNPNITIDYNCWYKTSGNWYYWGGLTGNTMAGWITASSQGAFDIYQDPFFIDASKYNFLIKMASPCIDAGTDVGLTQDFAGNTVPYGWGVDIGAYEYVGSLYPLDAEINASPTSGWVPLAVDFTGSASGGTKPYSYNWDFGDGESSSEQNPSHIYYAAGDYTVNLAVTDSEDNEDTDSLIINASELTDPLEASVTASPTSGEVPLIVSFTGSASGGTTPYSYSWDFGDGGSSSAQNTSHTYTIAGTYNVTLTVTDAQSNQASDFLTITAATIPAYQLAISAATGSPAPGAGGTTDPSPGNYAYSVGSSFQVEAIPNEDYRFSKWTGDVSDSEAYNEEVTITMDKNKSISAFFSTKCGDVTGDLSITPADAQAAFEIFLGIISNPTESEIENADVNCSGTKTEPSITPADAQAILEKFLGVNELPCDCSGSSRSGSVLALMRLTPLRQVSDVNLIIDDIRVDQDGEVVVPIIVDNPFNIKAFGFDLIFPSRVLEFVGVERSGLMEDFYQVDANKIAEGVVRAGGYRSKPIMSHTPRVLIRLIFKVVGEGWDIGLDSFSIVNTVDDIK